MFFLTTMKFSFNLFLRDMSTQLLMNLSDNSFTKIIDNFYDMAINMKKKLSSLEPSALLKVMMKMTSPTSDRGLIIITIDKDLDAQMF